MTNPGPDDDPIWALFDATGLQMRYLLDTRTAEQVHQDAVDALNANAGATDIYIVLVRFAEPHNVKTWYEVGDRTYAPPEGETLEAGGGG